MTTAKRIDVKDVLDLMDEGKHIPKLEAVVNYGEGTVLPEIIDKCNGEERIRTETQREGLGESRIKLKSTMPSLLGRNLKTEPN